MVHERSGTQECHLACASSGKSPISAGCRRPHQSGPIDETHHWPDLLLQPCMESGATERNPPNDAARHLLRARNGWPAWKACTPVGIDTPIGEASTQAPPCCTLGTSQHRHGWRTSWSRAGLPIHCSPVGARPTSVSDSSMATVGWSCRGDGYVRWMREFLSAGRPGVCSAAMIISPGVG
jgi:hypothetical protein